MNALLAEMARSLKELQLGMWMYACTYYVSVCVCMKHLSMPHNKHQTSTTTHPHNPPNNTTHPPPPTPKQYNPHLPQTLKRPPPPHTNKQASRAS
jgi:hypothetical protein